MIAVVILLMAPKREKGRLHPIDKGMKMSPKVEEYLPNQLGEHRPGLALKAAVFSINMRAVFWIQYPQWKVLHHHGAEVCGNVIISFFNIATHFFIKTKFYPTLNSEIL